MKVRLRGKGIEKTLDKRHFLAKGGEGEIYAAGDTVYKICEPGKMIPDGKFQELSVLTETHIVRPEVVLEDSKGKAIGYTMRFIADTYTLCQIFTKAFRLRNSVTPDTVLALVRQMQETIHFIHRHHILLVDLNELNFLLSQDFRDIWFIDVNSYQTPSFPATAIMESIRDRHCGQISGKYQFTEGTDWFSFGIVSFQMLIGIHPYKGKHPNHTNPKTALDERMRLNLSVLNSSVSYPQAACQPLTVLPPVYLEWYRAMFEAGKRLAPPADLVAHLGVILSTKTVSGSQVFDIKKLAGYDGEIRQFFYHGGNRFVVLSNDTMIGRTSYSLPQLATLTFTPKGGQPVAAWLDATNLRLLDLSSRQDIPITLHATNIMGYDGRVYVQNGSNILEVILTETGVSVIASTHPVGMAMEKATQWFDGVIIQNLFDAYYVSVFPQSKQCRQFAIRELDGYRIVDAKYESKVLMVVGVNRAGEYDRFVVRFAKDWSGYDVRTTKNITHIGLNFTVLDNGICIFLNEEEDIEIFKAEKDAGNVKIYQDPAIKGDMELCHEQNTALFTRGKELFGISVRKPS